MASTADEVIKDVASALSWITIDGAAVFKSVAIVDDLDSFVRKVDPLRSPEAGIVVQPTQRALNQDNGATYVEKMSVDILISYISTPMPGRDESPAIQKMQEMCEAVKLKLREDPTRGGRCELVVFNGQILQGTDITGMSKIVARGKKKAFYVISTPAAFGWLTN